MFIDHLFFLSVAAEVIQGDLNRKKKKLIKAESHDINWV